MAKILQTQIDCSTAQEFLDALSPTGNYFKEAKLTDVWLFRGQGKDDPLVPSLFRPTLKNFTLRNIEIYKEKMLAERDLLIQFFDMADKRGLTLPDDSQDLRATLETLASDRGDQFIGDLKGYG